MLRIPPLSDTAEQELLRMTRQEKGRVVLRAQLILWAAHDPQSIPQLAKRIGWSEERVRLWIKRFLFEGPKGLSDRPGRGRRPKQSPHVQQEMSQVLEAGQPPPHTGYTCWTISLLMGWLLVTFNIKVHASTVRRWIHHLDFHWQRPKTEPISRDPQYVSKLRRISHLFERVEAPDVILYEDETTLRLLPVIRGMWMKIGKQLRIHTGGGWNRSIKVFGALNALTGKFLSRIFDTCNAQSFIAFLEAILEAYPMGQIYIIVDNASWHHAHLVEDWLTTHPRLELVWLPTGSPKLNPVERIWGKLKTQVAANHWYGTLNAIRKAAEDFLDSLSPERTCQIAQLAA